MIKFIKNLLGFGAKETVKEILTPVKSDPVVTAVTASTYIEPAKPVNKVKAISVPATSTNTKPKAKPAVTQGNTKGGNGAVKQQPKQAAKPPAPKAPRPKQKSKRK